MTRRLRAWLPALLLAVGVAGWVAACKQGAGVRCQIDDDCEDGLGCNQATLQCASSSTNENPIDATLPDGPPVDALPIDALPIDAPVDTP